MITFYGYAVKKQGKYLGCKPKLGKQYYKRPRFPCVGDMGHAQRYADAFLGEVVKVKLTMEEVKDGK